MKTIYFIREKTSHHGGAETYLFRLSDSLVKTDIEFKTINSVIPSFLPSWLRLILFNLHLILIKRDKLYFSLERIVCPDIYRAGDGVHKVFLEIENKSKLNPLHKVLLFIEKKCFNNAKVIIANSIMVKNDIIKAYDIDPNKIEIIYNGFKSKENQSYERSFSKLSKEFNIKPNQSIILYVGSGYKRKGVFELLQILSKLNNKNFVAFVIGKEKRYKYYKKIVNFFSLEGKVNIIGIRKDVSDFYIASDIFILPSHYEPFGNVVLEAMCYGNVVFTTNQTGASELLDKDFVMSDSKDFSVVKKIDNLLINPTIMREIKQRNLKISKNYSIEINRDKTLKVLNQYFND